MKWEKLGNVFCPSPDDMYTHAMLPVCHVMDAEQSLIRIYYTHRDQNNVGFPTYMDAVLQDENFKIVYNHHEPIIAKPAVGNFDDSGVNITSILKTEEHSLCYYYGWNLGVTVPFRNSIGIASLSDDATHLTRLFPGPILDRSRDFPNLCATPCVLFEDGIFKMWFASGEPWKMVDDTPHVACHIGYAESQNGIDWERQKEPCVAHGTYNDHVLTTPCVIKQEDTYRMWYSFRGEKYRIGYAESKDGKFFERKDSEVGITVSTNDWDSEMICYPHVFSLNHQLYMLYCGNAYGKSGFGLAILKK